MVKGLSESDPCDSGLPNVCCVLANAALQLLEGRIHLASGLGQRILIHSNGGSPRRIFVLGLSRKKSEDGEDSLRFSSVKAAGRFFFYWLVWFFFLYFTENQENLGFGQSLSTYFCIIRLPNVFKFCNRFRNRSQASLFQLMKT